MDPALQELAAVAGAEEIEAIIKLRDPDEPRTHVRVVSCFGDIATCRLPGNRIEEVWAHPATVSLKAARLLEYDGELQLDEQVDDVERRVTDRRRPEDIGLTGRDVVIGVVDWGVDVAHPNLVRPDGNTRFLAVWDQRGGRSAEAPKPYDYGRVLTRDDINAALATEHPYESLEYHPEEGDPLRNGAHGTHVCDIAAGSGAVPGSPKGLAPGADLVFVHLSAGRLGGLATLGDSVRILEALDFIRRMAGDRPWVANTSLGRHSGGHRGLTLVEQGMDAMLTEAPGRAIVQSCGNYYLARAHASGRLLPGRRRTLTWQTGPADVTPNELEIWYSTRDRFHVTVSAPVGNGQFHAGLGEITPIVIAGEEVGRIYHRKRDPTDEHHVDIFLRPGAPSGDWQVELSALDAVDGRFDAYVERDPGCPDCQSRFHPDDFEPRRTLGSICNGFHTIAVGAYDPHDPGRALGTFSSSGLTRDGRQRPNLIAPGVSVLAARSAARNEPVAPLTRKTGTSMAAPHVTGTIALMFEAARRPLSIRETHRLLLTTTDESEGDTDYQFRIGTGFLNTASAVEAAVGGVEPFPPDEKEETKMKDQALESRVDPREPVLIEGAESQALAPDTQNAIGAVAEAQQESEESEVKNEAEMIDHPSRPSESPDVLQRACSEVENSEARDEELGVFDERWVAIEEIKAEATTPEELAEIAAEAIASVHVRHILGPQAVASPALLFDSIACDMIPGLRQHCESRFDVLALPGDNLKKSLQPGDLVVERALGEGDLALAEVIVEECPASRAGLYAQVFPLDAGSQCSKTRLLTDRFGRLEEKTLILRPWLDLEHFTDETNDVASQYRDIVSRLSSHLRRKFLGPNDPGLFERRKELRMLFRSIAPLLARPLYERLEGRTDPLGRLFRRRLATATRNEMLGILRRKFKTAPASRLEPFPPLKTRNISLIVQDLLDRYAPLPDSLESAFGQAAERFLALLSSAQRGRRLPRERTRSLTCILNKLLKGADDRVIYWGRICPTKSTFRGRVTCVWGHTPVDEDLLFRHVKSKADVANAGRRLRFIKHLKTQLLNLHLVFRDDESVIKELGYLDRHMKLTTTKLNAMFESGLWPSAAPHYYRAINDWIEDRQRDPNSVYNRDACRAHLLEAVTTGGGEPFSRDGERGTDTKGNAEMTIKSLAPTRTDLVDRAAAIVASADVRRVLGLEAVASPALLFDSVTRGIVPGLRQHFESRFDIVALPGENLAEPPQPGDVVVVRALGEGAHAQAEVIVEQCTDCNSDLFAHVVPVETKSRAADSRRLTDALGRLDERILIVRPLLNGEASRPTRQEDLAETPAAFVAIAGALISAGQLGLAVFDRLERHLLSGSFSVSSHAANYIHDPSPTGLRVQTKRFFFGISAYHPRYGIGTQSFYFQLTLEYDGFNIRRVSIIEDRGRSSTLVSSTFSITFAPARFSARNAPIASVVYNIAGRWDPIGRGDESFDGSLIIDAQGRLRRLRINSPQRWVWRKRRVTSRGGGAVPRPTGQAHLTSVYFNRTGRTSLASPEIRHIHDWYMRLPGPVRQEIRAGRIPIDLKGRASTTATVQRNQTIARARAQSVAAVFRDVAGSSADIRIRAHGELGARTSDNQEDPNERRVDIELKYDVYRLAL